MTCSPPRMAAVYRPLVAPSEAFQRLRGFGFAGIVSGSSPGGGRVNKPGHAPGSAEVVARRGGHRQRRPTGAPPALPKQIGLTGKLWLGAVLVIVLSGSIWLHFSTRAL